MKICKGSTRTVVIIGGLAFKFPVIRPKRALKNILLVMPYAFKWMLRLSPNRVTPSLFRKLFWDYRKELTPAYNLFAGIMANVWERRLYKRTKNPLLMPTYFSLWGIMNIQRAGTTLSIPLNDLFAQFIDLSSAKEIFCDVHLFERSDNFCWLDGHLRIVDYGNETCHNYIKKYGVKLYEEFSLEYTRKKHQERLILCYETESETKKG